MSKYDINELIEMKNNLLSKKAITPKEDTETIKNITLEYMRIQKKIQYYRDNEYRQNKIKEVSQYNKENAEKYNEYHKTYRAARKQTLTDYIICV